MQTSVGKIIIGVDGSDASLDAVRWAFHYAEVTGDQIEAVTSWRYPTQYGYESYGGDQNWQEVAQTILDSALQKAGVLDQPEGDSQTKVTRVVIQGHPADILAEASRGADLLVVGSRGHGGFSGMLLGSVSQYVVAHAHCPVVVVRHEDPVK